MDVIDGLLRIKRIRQDSREADMRRARQLLEQAAQALRDATQQQQQQDRERTERENKLFDDVCQRVVQVRDLNELRGEVDIMKEAAKQDAEAVVQAQKHRTTRRESFDQSTVAWRIAAHATARFEDLSAEQQAERARHAEWLADLELEEHSGRSVLAQAMQADEQEV
jgi:type III secretion protein O